MITRTKEGMAEVRRLRQMLEMLEYMELHLIGIVNGGGCGRKRSL